MYLSEIANPGIFLSPIYGGYYTGTMNAPKTLYSLTTYRNDYNTYIIDLNVKSMDGNGTVIFHNADQNVNTTLHPNQTITQEGTNFKLNYQNFDNFNFFIEYTVTQIKATTTTRTTTTPKPTTTPPIQPTNVTLNSENPYYVFWLDNLEYSGYLTVCTENDDTLELFVTTGNYLNNYNLYDYNGFYHFVGSSTDASNWRNIAIYTNALSLTFLSDISLTLNTPNSIIIKDEKLNQRGIIVSPSYTGFSTKVNGSNLLYQFNNYGGTTNKMGISFTVKKLDNSVK
uniref:Uncharacterized protein n=1 Tax=Panagrolaimus sp. ES5 TaxID=591445 RepID=A0AC34G599_9BILA